MPRSRRRLPTSNKAGAAGKNHDYAVSPLAVALPELPPLAGVRLGAAAAGIRYQGRTDVVMMEVPPAPPSPGCSPPTSAPARRSTGAARR